MTERTDIMAFYQRADTRMRDLPVYNPALSVFCSEPVITPCQHPLFVVVTPWCMNLLLQHPELPAGGESFSLALPSGVYEFTASKDDLLGRYGICSLFSPMWEFESQTVAEEVALNALDFIMQEENQSVSERQLLKDEHQRRTDMLEQQASREAAALAEADALAQSQTDSGDNEAVSRRSFLRGKLSATSPDRESAPASEAEQ